MRPVSVLVHLDVTDQDPTTNRELEREIQHVLELARFIVADVEVMPDGEK